MPLSIKVNLRVTGHCNQGGRKYMEDMFSVAYQQTSDDKDLEYAFFGIFDGHGGGEAATFAKEHLMDIIVKQKNFWSDKDEDVLRAIRDGYVNTHYAMWRELEKWPRTASGLPSTAGTTASIAFIRKGKIYIGHVGDSGIILGYQEEGDPQWKAKALTKDHKPESVPEMMRIHESGGKVVSKSGVPRVVWNRPRIGHKGPVRRSTHIDEIPFLAVARSLGDLWSYNSELDTFVVSPEPDVKVVTVDVKSHRCLIFGTDGLWNMLTPQGAVAIVQAAERHNEKHFIASQQTGHGTDSQMWINPSKSLVDRALERWSSTRLRADNTSVVTLMLDPPGPSRGEVLLNRKKERVLSPKSVPVPIPTVSHHPPSFISEEEHLEKSEIIENPAILIEPETPVIPSELVKHVEQPVETSETIIIQKEKLNIDVPRLFENIIEETLHEKTVEENADINPVKLDEIPTTSSNLENIQVAEISSSDLSNSELDEEKPVDEIIPDKSIESIIIEKPDSPTKCFDIIPSLETLVEKLPKLVTPTETMNLITEASDNENFELTRQSGFSGTCENFNCDQKLKKSSQFDLAAAFSDIHQNNLPAPLRRRQQGNSLTSRLDKRPNMLCSTRTELRSTRKRQSTNSNQSQVMPATSSCIEDQKMRIRPVDSRLKKESLRPGTTTRTIDAATSSKRRHSSTFLQPEVTNCNPQEPLSKRRTRSEDQRCPTDENDPANQGQKNTPQSNCRLRWPNPSSTITVKSRQSTPGTSSSLSANIKEGNNSEKIPSPTAFQRRSLEKKATPVKTIRRPSINGSNRVSLRGSFALRDWDQSKSSRRSLPECSRINRGSANELPNTPQRWLRSDTIAATPIKTLRSRNVDITGHTVPPQVAHQYGIVKQNRNTAISGKIKLPGSSNKVKSSASLANSKLKSNSANKIGPNVTSSVVNNTVPGIAKRVKSTPYNPSARSLGTRSRLKRLGK